MKFDYGKATDIAGCLRAYTVGMANAVTPSAPGLQLARLGLPIVVGMPVDDALIDVDRLESWLADHGPVSLRRRRLPGLGHLDVILGGASFIGEAVREASGVSSR